MDHIFIKEEIEDTYDTLSLSSTSESYSSRSSTTSISASCSIPASSSISFPPTQRVLPARQGEAAGVGGGFQHFSPHSSEDQTVRSKPPSLKRSGSEIVSGRSKHHRSQSSLMSPPLLPPGPSFQLHSPNTNLAVVPGYPHNPQAGAGTSKAQDGGVSQEDEWKNIKVMLNCISGMVEKTQSAISILQQRQAEVANLRTAEELVAEVQAKANMAILEVKQAALEEIKRAKSEQISEILNDCKEESCLNCGCTATETCSGCSLARYCGPFCQHKDWEDHSKVCRADLTLDDISGNPGVVGSPHAREKEAKRL